MTIRNTASLDGALEALVDAVGPQDCSRGGAILGQEARGAAELLVSEQIPADMMPNQVAFEKLGFKIVGKTVGDPLFVDAELPQGWTKRPGEEDPRHMVIVDAKGRVRAGIFYKAAFYDRVAHVSLVCRYTIKRYRARYGDAKERDGDNVVLDQGTGRELFVTNGEDAEYTKAQAFLGEYREGKDAYDFDAVYE